MNRMSVKKLYINMSPVEQSKMDLKLERKLQKDKRDATREMAHYDQMPRVSRDIMKQKTRWELLQDSVFKSVDKGTRIGIYSY